MPDNTPQPVATPGQMTLEQFQRQQQLGMLGAAQMQFVNCITSTPPPSAMPTEVRVQMYKLLRRTVQLFEPRNDEERAAAGEELGG